MLFRGNHKSYYGEGFIVSNEKVDAHVAEIGYASDVCPVHRLHYTELHACSISL